MKYEKKVIIIFIMFDRRTIGLKITKISIMRAVVVDQCRYKQYLGRQNFKLSYIGKQFFFNSFDMLTFEQIEIFF